MMPTNSQMAAALGGFILGGSIFGWPGALLLGFVGWLCGTLAIRSRREVSSDYGIMLCDGRGAAGGSLMLRFYKLIEGRYEVFLEVDLLKHVEDIKYHIPAEHASANEQRLVHIELDKVFTLSMAWEKVMEIDEFLPWAIWKDVPHDPEEVR